jgi:hypothetical protein
MSATVESGGELQTCCGRCGRCDGDSYMVLDWVGATGLKDGRGAVPWICLCEECVEPGDLVGDE